MRKFLKSILTVGAIVCLVSILVELGGLYRLRSKWNFRIHPDRHIVVFGSSLGEVCFNDSILSGWQNLCKGADYYVHCVPVLENVLSANSQIDTVVIVVGIPNLIVLTDEFLYSFNIQRLRDKDDRIALSDRWVMKYNTNYHNLIPYLLTSGYTTWCKEPTLGKFLYLQCHNLHYGVSSIDEYARRMEEHGGREYPCEEIYSTSKAQIAGLEKMIEICQRHQVTCVLFNTPLYQIDRFIDDKGYKEYLSTLNDSLLIADYTSFVMPDTTCYGDVHHLNGVGANFLCRHIKEKGLKMEYLIDYLK